jgi:hypothetical protein
MIAFGGRSRHSHSLCIFLGVFGIGLFHSMLSMSTANLDVSNGNVPALHVRINKEWRANAERLRGLQIGVRNGVLKVLLPSRRYLILAKHSFDSMVSRNATVP